jgi:tRNA1(Val) A37 N6-methylase TrmN6
VLEQAEALTQRYHVVVANPPYMGAGAMNPRLKEFTKEKYADSAADLFAAFIARSAVFALPNGYFALITMQS